MPVIREREDACACSATVIECENCQAFRLRKRAPVPIESAASRDVDKLEELSRTLEALRSQLRQHRGKASYKTVQRHYCMIYQRLMRLRAEASEGSSSRMKPEASDSRERPGEVRQG
jgi:transposase